MSPSHSTELSVFPEGRAFATGAARVLRERIREAGRGGRRLALALAGGSTPEPVYRELVDQLQTASQAELDIWKNARYFWSDERVVPPGDGRSNVRRVRETFLDPLGVKAETVFVPPTGIGAEACAAAYGSTICDRLQASSGQLPSFDLVLLGLGRDGHIASLFPEALTGDRDAQDPVLAASSLEPPHERISFSYRLIERAKVVAIVVSGERKANVVGRVLTDKDPSLPATQLVFSACRGVEWLLDEGSASLLRS